MGAFADQIEREIGHAVERPVEQDIFKARIAVSGYMQERNGKMVHVSAYNRRSLTKRILQMKPGESIELPDGRRIGKKRDGSLTVVTKPGGSRGRRVSSRADAVDAVRTASARDDSSERTLGGKKKYANARAAERKDADAKKRAKEEDNPGGKAPSSDEASRAAARRQYAIKPKPR